MGINLLEPAFALRLGGAAKLPQISFGGEPDILKNVRRSLLRSNIRLQILIADREQQAAVVRVNDLCQMLIGAATDLQLLQELLDAVAAVLVTHLLTI